MGKKKKKAKDTPGELLVCRNPKATKGYDIEERLECGMVLMGSEVKSMRARQADLDGSYCGIEGAELFLYKMHIAPYAQAGHFGHDPRRPRKLLAHNREIQRLVGQLAQQGYALVPLRIYFKNGRAKVELGLGKGRKQSDQRESIKRKLDLREARSAMGRGK